MSDEGIVRCVLEEQVFQGEGRKKADAKRDAAANALAFLQQQPLWEAQHKLPPLQDVLNACFSNKVGPTVSLCHKPQWCDEVSVGTQPSLRGLHVLQVPRNVGHQRKHHPNWHYVSQWLSALLAVHGQAALLCELLC